MKNILTIMVSFIKKFSLSVWQKFFLFPIKIPLIGLLIVFFVFFTSEYVLSRTQPVFFTRLFNLSIPKPVTDTGETGKLLSELGKLITLPTDENPTIATITDIEKIKNQPFFKNAANGDKVIIYTANHKAILYRPTTKMIIDVGPISTDNPSASTPSATLK